MKFCCKLFHICLLCFTVLLPSLRSVSFAEEKASIIIGTGSVSGVYFPLGGAICRMVNNDQERTEIGCSIKGTEASRSNLEGLFLGKYDIGIVQSDWQSFACNGSIEMSGFPNMELRSLFSLYPEIFTIVVRKESGINNYVEFKGKRLDIGISGSGTKGNVDILNHYLGWNMDDSFRVVELKSSEQFMALCNNEIDAFILTAGQPNGTIMGVTTACDTTLVNVDGPAVDKMLNDNSCYARAVIPGGMYPGTDVDTRSFGVQATVVTSSILPDRIAYEVVKAVFENFDKFKKMHPALAHLNKEKMISTGLVAPIHSGALKYYKEVGLMK